MRISNREQTAMNLQYWEKKKFKGDKKYCIDCTGDAVVGDKVCFSRAVFGGSFRNPIFLQYETVKGEIIKDSYGKKKQQHTFTLRLSDGSTILIKGRNLYRNGVYRMPWKNEEDRKKACEEKHKRGAEARSARLRRIERKIEENETW